MSDEGRTTAGGLATQLLGIIILVLGFLLVYFSLKSDTGITSPRVFMPIGLAVALVGGFMILVREV